MFGSDCRGCFSVPTYEAALAHWERMPRPRGAKWEPHQRPLDDARKHHYRLEMGASGEYFDAVLYRTIMMRVHKPLHDGRQVQYTHWDSTTSNNFLWRVCRASRVMHLRTTDGKTVMVPVSTEELGTSLWFTNTHSMTIDVARSHHQPVGRVVRSLELRQWRKDMLTNLAPLFQILEFQAEEIRQEWEPEDNKWSRHPGSLREMSVGNRELVALSVMCQKAGPVMQELAAWKAHSIDILRDAYREVITRSLNARDYRGLELPTTDVLARTATRTLLNYMEAAYSLTNGPRTRRVPLPDFPESLPRKFVFL